MGEHITSWLIASEGLLVWFFYVPQQPASIKVCYSPDQSHNVVSVITLKTPLYSNAPESPMRSPFKSRNIGYSPNRAGGIRCAGIVEADRAVVGSPSSDPPLAPDGQ